MRTKVRYVRNRIELPPGVNKKGSLAQNNGRFAPPGQRKVINLGKGSQIAQPNEVDLIFLHLLLFLYSKSVTAGP